MRGFKLLNTSYTRPLSLNFAEDMMKQPSKLEAGQIKRSCNLGGHACSGFGSRFSSSSKATAGFFCS